MLDADFSVEILEQGQCLESLGTQSSLEDVTGAEVKNRIAAGWRKFWALQKMQLNHSCSVKKRLRLFDSTVSGTVLWASESWSPRVEELRRFQSTQRAMLRRIVGCSRRPEELWIDWIQRTTRKARAAAKQTGVQEWPRAHLQRK